jgi:predicted transcriptional regulator
MAHSKPPALSKRERQIMDVLYRCGQCTAAQIHTQLEDAPTYTTVRGLLRILEEKGHVRHREEGPRFVYVPLTPREHAGASQLSHVVRTFFDGSPSKAMAALLGESAKSSDEELQRLERLIAETKTTRQKTKRGRS